MEINALERKQEEKYLDTTIGVIREKVSEMGQELFDQEEKIKDFRKYTWERKSSMDSAEMMSFLANDAVEIDIMMMKGSYFKKLFRIQNNPYFGSIIFKDDENKVHDVYIGITYLDDELENHLVYDWRTPICSLFYDNEVGECFYEAPGGKIKGELRRKRQYKIEDGNLVHIFDNNVNINDDLLQEVLATSSSEHMKNIVNTIQQEQNKIIRNTIDRVLVVQGIAGSGKTSVALHRIAFLLYKLEHLNSNNVLIFSPNSIFSEYISNVLPELGEDNTLQTTFHEFLDKNIVEYRDIESFTDFVSRYYKSEVVNKNLIVYKQSDEIVDDINAYINNLRESVKFTKDIAVEIYEYSKEELNDLFKRYSTFSLFDAIEQMSIKLSEVNYDGKKTKAKSFHKLLKESVNFEVNFKEIFKGFFRSRYCRIEVNDSEISILNKRDLSYEDACLFVYIKGILSGFPINNAIKEVVIDEAQDYSKLQYIIISKIFKKSGYTILGDVNQTINPYYKYNSLEVLKDIFKKNSNYIELNKTYRSSAEIIEYTNSILGLKHVSAIRKEIKEPVKTKKITERFIGDLIDDINKLEDYHNIAIITKDNNDAKELYKRLNNSEYELVEANKKVENKKVLVIPAFLAKGLEFDSVIVIDKNKELLRNEKYLYYVACTRSQHKLIVYN